VEENRKSLLVRADFVLGHSPESDRRTYKRWRGILRDVLPRLLGCERRCPRAEKVRLRSVADHPLYSAWLRIPIERRPDKKRVRKLTERLRTRLERSLLLIDGSVVKLRVRRCRPRAEAGENILVHDACENVLVNPVDTAPVAAPVVSPPLPVEEPVSLPMLTVPPEAPTPAVEQTASTAPAA
jgi:hypothetical protein